MKRVVPMTSLIALLLKPKWKVIRSQIFKFGLSSLHCHLNECLRLDISFTSDEKKDKDRRSGEVLDSLLEY